LLAGHLPPLQKQERLNKNIVGLSVVVELLDLKGRDNLNIPVESIVKY